MKLLKLSGTRDVILHNDDAFEAACQNPGKAPERGDFETAEAFDAALARHGRALERFSAWQRYQETYDTSHLQPFLRPGAKPVVFKVRALDAEQSAVMLDMPNAGLRFIHAVRYGVVAIENLEAADEFGNILGVHKSERIDAEYGKALDEDSMRIFRDQATLIEVAIHVQAAAKLPKGLRKSG